MVSILLTILFLMALGTFFIYGFFQFFTNFNPSNRKIVKDVAKLKEEISEWTSKLVPWNREEMELLSFSQIEKKVKRGLSKSAKGIFTSIYHEPLIAYNYKQYISTGATNALLIAHTSKHEFAYRIKKKEVFINIDNQFAGTLKENGCFYGGPKDRMIARINKEETTAKRYPVLVGEKEVASLVNRTLASVPNPRAFKFVSPMQAEEEKLFLSIAVLEMVTESF